MTLVLFTAKFPYDFTEQFLETEIVYLSKKFDKIIIQPMESGNRKLRPLPENCSVMEAVNDGSGVQKILKGLFNAAPYSSVLLKDFQKAFRSGQKSLFSFFSATLLSRRLQRNKKLLTLLDENSFFYFYWARDLATIIPFYSWGANFVFTRYHGYDLYLERQENYIPFHKETFDKVDFPISICQHGKKYLEKIYHNKEVRNFPLGVLSKVLNLPSKDGVFRILSCSNDALVKRIALIISSITLIKEFKIEWTHLGDADYHSYSGYDIPKNISIKFKGQLPNSEVYDYYANEAIDLFINLSSSEGLPVTIMEALSAGVPVMATDVGGTSELVNDSVGRLLPANPSKETVAEEIRSFQANKNKASLREAAHLMWKEKCNADKNYSTFSDFLYKECQKLINNKALSSEG